VRRGALGRGKNPYFPAFHLLADDENYDFRDGFRVEPAHILAHRGARSGMVSGRASLNLR
jgi:hypothetical protein